MCPTAKTDANSLSSNSTEYSKYGAVGTYHCNAQIDYSVDHDEEDLPSISSVTPLPQYIDQSTLQQHYKKFLCLIDSYLPIKISWILTKDPQLQIVPRITHVGEKCRPGSGNDVLDGLLVSELLSFIETPGLQEWMHPTLSLSLYGHPLDLEADSSQYLLLISEDTLSIDQRQWLELQILIVRDYLALNRLLSQKQRELLTLQNQIKQSSHQLGTPLALIKLYADLLNTSPKDTAIHELVLPLKQATDDLYRHIQEIVVPHEDAHTVEQCDLRELIADSIRVLKPRLENQGIQVYFPHSSINLWINRWKIHQVFDNLLENAMFFSPRGGRIILSWVLFQAEVLIEICDEGPGLSEEDLSCAFSPHYSKRSGGQGLGLAIAQQIISDHHGRLWMSNLPEGGAKFSISLPCKD